MTNQPNTIDSITLTTGTHYDQLSLDLDEPQTDINSLISNINSNAYSFQSIPPLTTTTISNTTSPSITFGQNGIQRMTIGSNGNLGIGSTNLSGTLGVESMEDVVARQVKKQLQPVLSRLAILEEPTQEVLDAFESLKLAYEHYKTLEALMSSEIEKIQSKS
jgi:hypothetical protein